MDQIGGPAAVSWSCGCVYSMHSTTTKVCDAWLHGLQCSVLLHVPVCCMCRVHAWGRRCARTAKLYYTAVWAYLILPGRRILALSQGVGFKVTYTEIQGGN
jgi:hypothetical protein